MKNKRMGVQRQVVHIFKQAEKYLIMKVPMQCPLVVLVNVGWKEARTLGSEDGEVLGCFEFGAGRIN
jgi:hypothetical protein